jgi:hypothetical protein
MRLIDSSTGGIGLSTTDYALQRVAGGKNGNHHYQAQNRCQKSGVFFHLFLLHFIIFTRFLQANNTMINSNNLTWVVYHTMHKNAT